MRGVPSVFSELAVCCDVSIQKENASFFFSRGQIKSKSETESERMRVKTSINLYHEGCPFGFLWTRSLLRRFGTERTGLFILSRGQTKRKLRMKRKECECEHLSTSITRGPLPCSLNEKSVAAFRVQKEKKRPFFSSGKNRDKLQWTWLARCTSNIKRVIIDVCFLCFCVFASALVSTMTYTVICENKNNVWNSMHMFEQINHRRSIGH